MPEVPQRQTPARRQAERSAGRLQGSRAFCCRISNTIRTIEAAVTVPSVRVSSTRLPATPRSAKRKRGGDDIRIGKLEQAKADALHDEPGDPQGRRRLLRPRAEQKKTGADRGGTCNRQPLSGNGSPDEAAADRRGQHRACRGRSQDGAALGQRIAGDARQKIRHQQPDREGREIGQHADEIEQRKSRQLENFDRDDRTRRA